MFILIRSWENPGVAYTITGNNVMQASNLITNDTFCFPLPRQGINSLFFISLF